MLMQGSKTNQKLSTLKNYFLIFDQTSDAAPWRVANDLLSVRGGKNLITSIKLLQIFFLREYELFKHNTEKPETLVKAFWDSLCKFPLQTDGESMASCHAATEAMNSPEISIR